MKHATDVSRVPQLYLPVLLAIFQVFTHTGAENSPRLGIRQFRASERQGSSMEMRSGKIAHSKRSEKGGPEGNHFPEVPAAEPGR